MIQRLLIIAAGIIRKLKLNRQIAVIADILQGLDYRGIIADAASAGILFRETASLSLQ